MKSVVIDSMRSFKDVTAEKPTAGGKWVTLKVKDCAICGSDAMFWNGAAQCSIGEIAIFIMNMFLLSTICLSLLGYGRHNEKKRC